MTVLLVWTGQLAVVFPRTTFKGCDRPFTDFGLKLLYDASQMSEGDLAREQADTLEAVKRQEHGVTA